MADPELSKAKLENAYRHLIAGAVASQYGWKITPLEGDAFYVAMQHRSRGEHFVVKVRVDGFPQPPSYVLVNPDTRAPEPRVVRGYHAAWPGFCIHGTREFYEKGHREFADKWDHNIYTFSDVLSRIQVLINQS